jgi:enoyl-[acyl-carrier protein] reductase I
VANDRSIAWGISQALRNQGASLGMTYVNDSIKKRLEPLALEVEADFIAHLDVTDSKHIGHLQEIIQKKWQGHFDILVHSLAYAPPEALKGQFSQVKKADFLQAMEISTYSFIELCGALSPLMNSGSSIMTLTYHGAQKVVPNYHVMGVAKAALECSVRYLAYELGRKKGIRVNAISAGPIKTLAASGISKFRSVLDHVVEISPLKEGISIEDVGGTALYLASDLSGGTTGQVVYVDSGTSILSA